MPIKADEYTTHINDISAICEEFFIHSLKLQIAGVKEIISTDDHLSIALIGGFKAGKSSFINSIVGRDVLPVAVLPLTSVITSVKYGPVERAEVMFIDGSMEYISTNDLGDFITEERNPENKKRVAEVCVELPALKEYREIQFVDTPGLGSAYKHNTATSTGWLPRVGAALFVISVAQPLSEQDILALKELGQHTPEIIILLSKVDLVSLTEAEEVAGFIRTQARQHLNKEVQVFPFSNKPGFEVQRSVVYDFIWHSLAREREKKVSGIINHKLGSLLEKCHDYLNLALFVANAEQASRQSLSFKVQQEHQLLEATRNEIRLIVNDLRKKLQAELSDKLQEQLPLVRVKLTDELHKELPEWRGNLARTSEVFRAWIRERLAKELQTISEESGYRISEQYLSRSLTSMSRIVTAFQNRLGDDIKNALHTKFNGAQFEVQIEKPARPDIDIGNVFMTSWELLWFIIPMWVFRSLVNRQFSRRVPREVEKNLYRLASQWTEVTSRSIELMAQQANMFMDCEIATVGKMLTEAPNRWEEIEKGIVKINHIKGALYN